MPHVGHADSFMNDKHGSQSDISNWSSSNPITRVIKVTLPTPTISLYQFIHPYTHSFHMPMPPNDSGPEPPEGSGTKHRTCSEMHHNALCCVMKWQLPHLT